MSLDVNKIRQSKKGKEIITVSRNELQPFFSHVSADQNVYKCPFCPDRGHEGKGNKLYMNESKGIGQCFTCQLIVIFEESYNLEREVDNFKKKDFKPKDEKKVLDIMSWTTPAVDSEIAMNYIKSRKADYPPATVERYNLRFAEIKGVPVLIFPNEIAADGTTDFFQFKVLDEKLSYLKYTSVGCPPLMWLDMTVQITDSLILVEGVFDAMAINGIPMIGKTLSDRQQKQLREFCLVNHSKIKHIIVAPDGDVSAEDREKLAKLTQAVSCEIPVFEAKLPANSDPEDIAAEDRFEVFVPF